VKRLTSPRQRSGSPWGANEGQRRSARWQAARFPAEMRVRANLQGSAVARAMAPEQRAGTIRPAGEFRIVFTSFRWPVAGARAQPASCSAERSARTRSARPPGAFRAPPCRRSNWDRLRRGDDRGDRIRGAFWVYSQQCPIMRILCRQATRSTYVAPRPAQPLSLRLFHLFQMNMQQTDPQPADWLKRLSY